MSHERLSHDESEEYKELYDLNLLGLWCATGNEGTLAIRQEALELSNQSLEEGKSRPRFLTRAIATVRKQMEQGFRPN
jgi:hypothetical protein